MEVKDLLRTKRLEKGLTMKELAAMVGVSEGTISRWESGEIANMRRDKIKALADALGITPAMVMGWKGKRDENHDEGRMMPVLSRVAAGYPIEATGEVIEHIPIDVKGTIWVDYFGLRVVGDSMEPKISDGDTVIVRKQDDAESGEIVVVMVNGSDACVKRLKKFQGGIMLVSTNPAYEPITYTAEEIERLPVRIIGKVVELRAKF